MIFDTSEQLGDVGGEILHDRGVLNAEDKDSEL
jgi:hypothetical protein